MKIDRDFTTEDGSLPDLITRIRDTLRRRWLSLVLIAAAVFGLGAAATFMMTPQYSGAARIQIDPSRDPLAQKEPSPELSLSPEAIETEVSNISSLDQARKVVRRLHLDQNPEFSKGAEQASGLPASQMDREVAAASAVLKKLSVARDKLTYIIKIEFTSRSPIVAANVANGFADEYISSKVGSTSGVAEKQSQWFQKQLEQLAADIRVSDAKVAQYRAEAGISEATGNGQRGQTIVEQQIAPLSTQLAEAKSQAAADSATLAAARAQMASGGRDSVAAVLESPVISDLRKQRAEVLRSLSDIESRYGSLHPEMIKVRDQLTGLDQQIKEQTNRVLASLNASADAANARVRNLQASMGQLSATQSSNDRASVMADSLQREADAKRSQYEKLAQLSIEASQKAQNSIAQATIVDRAKTATKPSSPNIPLFLALALVLGLTAGGATIATQEMMVSGITSKTDLESYLGLQMLAAVPAIRRMKHPGDLLIDKPNSLFAESMRIARASILGVRSDSSVKIIAITSALPAEGKTTTALAFARTLAMNGSRTLLIECDVRRAIMQEQVRNFTAKTGLMEYLTGQTSLTDSITPGDVDNLFQLLVLKPHFDSGNLFGDGRMAQLLSDVRGMFDHVVLDLPPLVGLADGRFLAALADTTVLVVRWSQTPVSAATTALEWLRSDGVKISGAILTMVDPGSESAGAYYYSKRYSGYYEKA